MPGLPEEDFVARYGGVYEHSPWIARDSWALGHLATQAKQLSNIFQQTVDAAPQACRLALIRAHPDLAGRLAVAGDLTEDSAAEQSSAGLDQCSAEEFQLFQLHNKAYLEKFEFPFVMAVKNSNRTAILKAFGQRLANNYAQEFNCAIGEIHKIARMRLEQIF
jgi:OHCU decarboxylase